jgi:hypothetical protein
MTERDDIDAAVASLAHVEADIPSVQHPFAAVARAQLDKLGFFVPLPPDPRVVDVWMRRALWIFQTGLKIKASCLPDNETRAALAARMVTLGIPA